MTSRVANQSEKKIDKLLRDPAGTPVSLTKREARVLARRLFGSNPSLPEGKAYVRKVRAIGRTR